MLISDAKKLIGQIVDVEFTNRSGKLINERVEVFDVNFIALFGPCLITDLGDIRLDRISKAQAADQQAIA